MEKIKKKFTMVSKKETTIYIEEDKPRHKPKKKLSEKNGKEEGQLVVGSDNILRTGPRESASKDAVASIFLILCIIITTFGIAALWFSVFNNATLTISNTSMTTAQTEILVGTVLSPSDTTSHFSTTSEFFANEITENLSIAFSNIFGLDTWIWVLIGLGSVTLGFTFLVLMRMFSSKAYSKRGKEVRLASNDKLEKATRARCGECPSILCCFPACYKGVRTGAYILDQFYLYLIVVVIIWTILVSVTYATIGLKSKDLSLVGTIGQTAPVVRYNIGNLPDCQSGSYKFTAEQTFQPATYSIQSVVVANNDVGIPIWGLIIIGVGIVIILFVLKHYSSKICCS